MTLSALWPSETLTPISRSYWMMLPSSTSLPEISIALGVEDLDQRIHAAAAAANEVDLLHMIKQMLGIVGNKHNKATSK